MNRSRFDAYSKVILTIIAVCLVGLCVDRFTAQADAQATQPTKVRYDVVEAKTFRLVDEEGKERGAIRIEDGTAGLTFADGKGRRGVDLSVMKDGYPALVFHDKKHQARAMLALMTDGKPSLSFSNSQGKEVWHTP